MKKGNLVLLLAAPVLALAAVGSVAGANAATKANEVSAANALQFPTSDCTYTLITSQDDIAVGTKVAIVNTSAKKAAATQNSNNRAAVTITLNSASTEIVSFTDAPAVFELVEGTKTDATTFGFKDLTTTEAGNYLYAASSSKNYLKSEKTIDDNGSFTITIASNGNATVNAMGKNTRNLLKYNNSTSNGNLFSCYASGQQSIQLFKVVANTPEPDPEPVDTIEEDYSVTETLRNLCFDYTVTTDENGDKVYSDFTNVKMQFHYDVPNQANDDFGKKHKDEMDSLETGLFITDDENFEFKTTTTSPEESVADDKVGKLYKNNETGENGLSYTVGIMIPESQYNTKLYSRSYVLKNGKYMWGKSCDTYYSVYDMLYEYMDEPSL